MSTVYMNDEPVSATPARDAGKAKHRKKVIIGSVVAAAILTPGIAWAAYNLFGFGEINSAAATTDNLIVSNPRLAGKLVPGQTVGGAAEIGNSNDFAVTVKTLILQDSSFQTTGTGCDTNSVHPGGTAAASGYPGEGGGAMHTITIPAANQITLAPGETKTLTVPGVVSQDASATELCGVKAKFAVSASTGS